MNQDEQGIKAAQERLEWLRKRAQWIELGALLFQMFTLFLLCGIAFSTLEAIFHLPPFGRRVLFSLNLILLLGYGVIKWRSISQNPRLKPGKEGEEFWALALGSRASPEHYDNLLNALQVLRESGEKGSPHSSELARQALYLAISPISGFPLKEVLNFKPLKRSARACAAGSAVVIISLTFWSQSLLSASQRILHFNTHFTSPIPFHLSIEPAGGWVYRGEPITFTLSVDEKSITRADFRYRFTGSSYEQKVPVEMRKGRGEVKFEGFPTTFYYKASSGEVESAEYRMEVVTRPIITELRWKLFPPDYSRLPVVTNKGNDGEISGLAGSKWELEIKGSKELKAAWMEWASGGIREEWDSIPMLVDKYTARLNLTLKTAGHYRIRLLDREGHRDKDPVAYRVEILPDDPPLITLLFPPEDVLVGEELLVPIQAEGIDDYGILKVELQGQRLDDTTRLRVEIPLKEREPRVAQIEYLWNLVPLDLLPGDAVEFWLVAWDNDRVNGPKMGISEKRIVRLPTFEEIVQGLQEQETNTFDQFQQALEAARQIKEEVERISQELKRNPQPEWEETRRLQEALQEQSNLAQKLEQVKKSLDELVSRIEEHDLVTAETLEKYHQLQKLLEEVATPELKAAMEKLQQALESQDPEALRQALEEFDLRREEFLKQIERSLNILQQLQLERRLEELVLRAQEIRQGEEDLFNQTETGDLQQLASKQRNLVQKEEGLLKAMEEVSQLAINQKEGQTAQSLDSLAITLARDSLLARMAQAGQHLLNGDKEKAQQKLSTLTRKLTAQELALHLISQELLNRRKKELERQLERLTEELLIISQNQEQLLEESEQVGIYSPRYPSLSTRQGEIRQALEDVSGRMLALSQQTFFITPEMGASLGRALQQMGEALESFTSRYPRSARMPQERALGDINLSAYQLILALNQLKGSSSATGFEEMMERLSQMASAQQGLNEQTMPIPGPGGTQSMPSPETLSRLAAQQRALQEAMKRTAEEAKSMQEILGDLEGIAEAMGELSERLDQQRLDERTRQLQQQIVNRLLDATRSAREQDFSRQRESRTAQDLPKKRPLGLEKQVLRERLRADLLRSLQEGYTPDYRRIIREYFQNLPPASQP